MVTHRSQATGEQDQGKEQEQEEDLSGQLWLIMVDPGKLTMGRVKRQVRNGRRKRRRGRDGAIINSEPALMIARTENVPEILLARHRVLVINGLACTGIKGIFADSIAFTLVVRHPVAANVHFDKAVESRAATCFDSLTVVQIERWSL